MELIKTVNELQLYKVAESEYAILGKVQCTRTCYKTVEVDGETYHKQWPEEVIIDMNELYKQGKLKVAETDFLQYFGEPEIKLYYYEFIYSTTMEKICRYNYSTNNYIYFLMLLNEFKLLPKCIPEISNGKKDGFWRYNKPDRKPEYDFIIQGYGYNNYVTFGISIQDIIRYDIPEGKLFNFNAATVDYKDLKEICNKEGNKLDRLLTHYNLTKHLYRNYETSKH